MKAQVLSLDGKKAGDAELSDDVFGVPVRADILHRCVQYQRAKAQAGTHKTKGVSEISGTGKKPFKQKGTGNARASTLRAAQMRGGATIFGPVVRSHAIKLPKKVRKLGLKTALSAKQAEGNLHVLDNAALKEGKTKNLLAAFQKLEIDNALVIIGSELDEGFARAVRNIKHVDVLPSIGANVYDILRHRKLVLTQDAIKQLEERLK